MIEPTEKKDFITVKQFSKEMLLELLAAAHAFKEEAPGPLLSGKIMGSCFFEPSTRTRLSFESAMHRLGGSVIGFAEPGITSTRKGESLQDSMKVMEGYVDLIVIRHPSEGAARCVADATTVPVINAGDGANQHPSQTLLDIFSIQECQGRLDNLHVALVGDLKFGRTAHSLAEALSMFQARIYLVSPENLGIPSETCEQFKNHHIKFSYHGHIQEVIDKLDILYMTRFQIERVANSVQCSTASNYCTLRKDHLKGAKENLKILHPLPRNNEIPKEIDATPFAYYFQQAKNGLYVRQALLAFTLDRVPQHAKL